MSATLILAALRRALPYLLVTLVVAFVLGAAYRAGVSREHDRAEARIAEILREHAQQVAELERERASAEQKARETEQQWRADIDKVAQDARTQVQAAQRDAVAAAAVSDSLRERAAALARTCSAAATAAGAAARGQAASNPAAVLADLFSRADARAGELARIADERGAAGAGCERAADALRNRGQ